MTTIIDTIQAIVRHELAAVRSPELGVVNAIFPHADEGDLDNYGCDVRLKNTGLLLKRVPVATGHVGTVAVPNVGDQVLVAFEGGDVNQPIVIGRLYDDVDRPPVNSADEVIFRLPLAAADDASVLGAIRNHTDQSPPRTVELALPPKIALRIDDGTVTATAGSTELVLDQRGASGGTVTVTSGSTTIRMDQDGDITVDSLGSVAFTAAGDLSVSAGGDISLTAGRRFTAQGGVGAAVEGGTTASLTGGAAAQVRGATVAIQGTTAFTP